jgi:hypothetical protein
MSGNGSYFVENKGIFFSIAVIPTAYPGVNAEMYN